MLQSEFGHVGKERHNGARTTFFNRLMGMCAESQDGNTFLKAIFQYHRYTNATYCYEQQPPPQYSILALVHLRIIGNGKQEAGSIFFSLQLSRHSFEMDENNKVFWHLGLQFGRGGGELLGKALLSV